MRTEILDSKDCVKLKLPWKWTLNTTYDEKVFTILWYHLDDKPPPPTAVIVDKVGFFLMIGWDQGDQSLRVLWNGGTQVYVRASAGWAGTLQGLCGNYNQNPKDDYKLQVSLVSQSVNLI